MKSQREVVPQAIETKMSLKKNFNPLCHTNNFFLSRFQEDSLRLYQPSCWVQNSRLTDWDFGPKVPSWLVSKIGFDVNFLRQDTHNMCSIRNSWRFSTKKLYEAWVRYVKSKFWNMLLEWVGKISPLFWLLHRAGINVPLLLNPSDSVIFHYFMHSQFS
mgnify:CR=1 FL=1